MAHFELPVLSSSTLHTQWARPATQPWAINKNDLIPILHKKSLETDFAKMCIARDGPSSDDDVPDGEFMNRVLRQYDILFSYDYEVDTAYILVGSTAKILYSNYGADEDPVFTDIDQLISTQDFQGDKIYTFLKEMGISEDRLIKAPSLDIRTLVYPDRISWVHHG